MDLRDKKIIILEDELITSRFIKESLEALGAEILETFEYAEEAIEKINSLKPDIALIDIVLAGDMSGLEAAEIIYKKYNIPVVFITAYSDDFTIKLAKRSEPFGYLLKPIDQKELRINLEMALYKHSLLENVKENKLWLETTLNCIADGVIALNNNGKINFINKAAQKITGWDKNEAVGKNLMEVFDIAEYVNIYHDEKNFNELEKSTPDSKQCIKNIKNNKVVLIESSDAAIKNDFGKIYGIVIVFRMIEEPNKLMMKSNLKLVKNEGLIPINVGKL